jgi:HAD superfamily hydrolase (TIGR01662 family)
MLRCGDSKGGQNVAISGVIFDLGRTLIGFADEMGSTVEAQRALDLGKFLAGGGFDLDGASVFASYREELYALWEVDPALNYEYPASLAMLRALRRHLSHKDAARLARGALTASFEREVHQWELYPDTLSTLGALRDAGYRLGCISNNSHGAYVWWLVDRCELRPWLSPIYTSEEFGLRKPHPRIFQRVLDEWGLPPEEVVMVGDTLRDDVLGAHNAGMRGIWVDRPDNPWGDDGDNKQHITSDATIKQLAELPDLLAGDWERDWTSRRPSSP